MVQLPSPRMILISAVAAAWPMATASAQAPLPAPPPSAQWPVTLHDAKGAAKASRDTQARPPQQATPAQPGTAAAQPPAPPPNDGWTEAEIASARARCTAIISRYEAEAAPMQPIREGECGTPYPVQLTSVGKVTLSQPAIVNCEVISALGDWLRVDVQPAARQLLNARVASLEVISSYSCRNAYGRKRSRLSEHGRANAVDIKSFGLDRGQAVELLADWGFTERDVKAQIAAAQAAAKAHALAKAKADAEARAQAQARAGAGKQAIQPAAPSLAEQSATDRTPMPVPSSDGLAALRGMIGGGGGLDRPSALSLGEPSRLGGPKGRTREIEPAETGRMPVAPGQAGSQSPRQIFLRTIHTAACQRFGTVLGPEANEAHRNHFHLDMADRGGRGSYCE